MPDDDVFLPIADLQLVDFSLDAFDDYGSEPIAGLQSFSLTLNDVAFTQPPTVTITPVAGTMRRVGRGYMAFQGTADNDPTPRPYEVYLPMDRRQARRVSRRIGRSFTWRDRQPYWRRAAI